MDSITAQEYVEALRRQGHKAFLEEGRVFWRQYERFGLERQPLLWPDAPAPHEIRSLLWRSRALVATYVMPADGLHPMNSVLYICENRGYNLENLEPHARRNVRRAQRAFRFEFIQPAELLAHGARPYCDTRSRVGLSDGTVQLFKKQAMPLLANPGYQFVGAWCGDQLAAYLSLLRIDDWATVAAYAANEHLRSSPNYGLLYFALDYCLAQGRCSAVGYGLSSVQDAENASTLDYFKKKVGFEARPVHRVFQFHPILKPLVNPLTYWIVRGCSKACPQSRVLRKAAGTLAASLGKPAQGDTPAVAPPDSRPRGDHDDEMG